VSPPTSEVTTDGLNPALGVQPPPTLSAQTRPIRRHLGHQEDLRPLRPGHRQHRQRGRRQPVPVRRRLPRPHRPLPVGLRYYDPTLGRWTQQDDLNVIGDPANGNRYAYTGDDPINNISTPAECVTDSSAAPPPSPAMFLSSQQKLWHAIPSGASALLWVSRSASAPVDRLAALSAAD